MRKLLFSGALFISVLFLGQNCMPHSEEGGHGGVMDKIRHAQTQLTYDLPTYAQLDTANLLKVHASLPEVADFFTENRTSSITSFPCSNCHNQTLEQMQANRAEGIRKAHWDINLVHANSDIMNCTTCHDPTKMNQLVSLAKNPININESFKLCGQCHSQQFNDWQGGAHGKQLNGWKPPRVAKTCVSCHNPHNPSFPKRFPARLNTIKLGEE